MSKNEVLRNNTTSIIRQMDIIKQYYLITETKPEYHDLIAPYVKPSKKKIIFNGLELELHYNREFGMYIDAELKMGSAEDQQITIVDLPLY